MEGHSRKLTDAAFASAPASERKGIHPLKKSGGRKQVRIAALPPEKTPGVAYAPAFFLGGSRRLKDVWPRQAAGNAFISARKVSIACADE
jgi:hypothetical protein